MDWINDSSFHVETRNAILMILVPRQLHVDDDSQAAFLRAAVSRVRQLVLKKSKTLFKLANKTIIDREGVFYLKKVMDLVCHEHRGLGLEDIPVNVTYKTYYNSRYPDYQTK